MAEPSAQIQSHNSELLEQLEVGDLVQFPRGLYSHWAVYIGEGEVAHLAGAEDDGIDGKMDINHLFTICGRTFHKAFVKVDRLVSVAGNCRAVRNNKHDHALTPLPSDKIVGNALTKLGEVGYNILYKNCEHFASWCRYGEASSGQADRVLTGLSVVTILGTASAMVLALARGAKIIAKNKKKHT